MGAAAGRTLRATQSIPQRTVEPKPEGAVQPSHALTLWADALSVPTVRRVLVPTEPHFGSIGPADEHEPLHSVRCRNVTYECTEERLRQTFARFGPVASCVIVRDAHSGLSKGTAFVKFRSKEAADAAVEAANPSNPVHLLTRAHRCARTPGAIA